MGIFRLTPIVLFLLLGSPIFAYTPKEGNVTATFGPYIYRTHYRSSGSGAESPFLTGQILIANGDFNDHESLEIIAIHMNQNFFREQGSLVMGEQSELLHLGLGYRRWLNPYLSAGLSFYSSYTMGVPKVIHSDFPSGQEIDTSARDTTEYGFDLGLQSELWQKDNLQVLLGANYAYSVTNKKDEYGNHYAFYLGLKYMVQEKYRRAGPPARK